MTWRTKTNNRRHNRNGELVDRKTIIGIYYCPQPHKELRPPECAKSVSSRKADEQAWEKICDAINKPEYLMARARALVVQLRERANNLHEDEKRIKRELEAIATERQWTITQARKGGITTTDMEGQLSILTMQELNLKTELASLGQAISTNMLTNWEAKFNEYLEDLLAGIEELKNAAPETPEERHHVFLLKKKVVDVLLEEATIDENKEIHVKIRVDLLRIVGDDPESGDSTLSAVETQSGEIYTRIPDLYPAGQLFVVL